MQHITTKKPVLGKSNGFSNWIEIPAMLEMDRHRGHYLSVNPKSTIEIYEDKSDEPIILVFPISRHIEITRMDDGDEKFWSTIYNEKDIKQSEIPPKNTDDYLK